MKIQPLLITALACLPLFSCGGDSPAPAGVAQGNQFANVPSDVATKFRASAKLPDSGDYRVTEFPQVTQVNQYRCLYATTEKATVTTANDTVITISYDSTTQPAAANNAACPPQVPSFKAHGEESWTPQKYVQVKVNDVQTDLDPSRYTRGSYVQNAEITASQEESNNGLRTQLVSTSITEKNGTRILVTYDISLDSLFLAAYAHADFRNGSSTPGSREDLLDFSVKQLGGPKPPSP